MPDFPEGSAVVTPTDMYNELREVGKAVAKLDGKLDKLEKIDDHESRIRTLEKKNLVIPLAGTAGLGGLLTSIWQMVNGG